jgi:phospholipase C
MLTPGLTWDPPSSLIAGEDLLARLYHAIRSSSSPTGSNYRNTTLVVTFDEHGGTYDHIAPPPAAPPDPAAPPGQFGFTFNRSGVRLPTLAISAWIPERTVVTEEYRATSVLSTLRERWNLGAPFSGATPPPAACAPSSPSTSHEANKTGPRFSPVQWRR